MSKPWAHGPRELLDHGLGHLQTDSDFDRRIALISIDNSVEIMIKTFLGLPERVTGIKISRKRLNEARQSFPILLETLEEFAKDKLKGIDLSDIEWYHRLRNELYHGGNGLTVEKQKVEVYAEIAIQLHRNLFYGPELSAEEQSLVGRFLTAWNEFEQRVNNYTARTAPRTSHGFTSDMLMKSWFPKHYDQVRTFRNNLVHGTVVQRTEEIELMTTKVEEILKDLNSRLKAEIDAYNNEETT